MNNLKYALVLLFFISSCKGKELILRPVSYAEFELFVHDTNYITDAEKYGWSIVQTDVYNFKKVDQANWKMPDGSDKVSAGGLPVTQVSYNDALAYCKWANKRLPSYDEYWGLVKNDHRIIVSENTLPISEVDKVNIRGNVWDITHSDDPEKVRLAGGSLFCSVKNCHGTVKEKELFVDRETANIHIGFSVLEM